MAEWTRVTYFLPVTSVNDQTAYLRTLNYLRSRHPDSGDKNPLSGFTSTIDDPAVISGFYWSERSRKWVDDKIVILFIDFPAPLGDNKLDDEVKKIKAQIEKFYVEEGSAQEELWCTAEGMRVIQ